MKKLLAALALLVLAALLWLFFFRADDPEPRVLDTATLSRGTVRQVLEATGIIKSQVGAIVKIGARATGEIRQMLVKVGDEVERGDLIAVIDDRELQAQKQEAAARMTSARAEQRRVTEVFPLQIEEARANLSLAEARERYARLSLERQRELVDRDLEARDALDQARRDYDVARGEVQARKASLTRLEREFREESTKARKAVSQAEAAQESVQVRISYTRITSPISGVVSQVAAQEGETVVSGLQVANLITVIDPLRLEMWIYVDETDIGQIRPGMEVTFRVDAYPDRTFAGFIDRVYPEPEVRDNIVYYQAIVELSRDQAALLRPEMTTQNQIVVRERKDVLALPNSALKWVGDRQLVFRVADGNVETVTPELGLQGLTRSEVVSGLSEGDVVGTQVVLPDVPAGPENGGGGGERGGGRRGG